MPTGHLAATVKTPTFKIGLDRQPGQRSSLLSPSSKGFTLIELLVVLAIGATLVALVPPAFERLREVSQYRDTVRALIVDLRQARQQAQAFGQTVVFRVNLADRQFGIEGRPFKAVPPSLDIKATIGKTEAQGANPSPAIVFTPEGGSSGGTIELVRASGSGVNIKVDWLFGHITQEPHTP